MNNRDEFDDPKSGDFLGSVGPKAAFFIVLIALSFMIGVVWKLYVGGGNGGSENVPIVRVDTEPYKVAPEEAGGMEMPHKDSTIFSSLNSDRDEDDGIENLLADDDDEEPMPRSQLFAGLNTERNADLHAEAQETPLDQPLSEDEERIMSQAKEAEAVVTSLVENGAEAIVDSEEDAVEENIVIEVPKKVDPVLALKEETEDLISEAEALLKQEDVKPVTEPVKEVVKEEPKPVAKVEPIPAPAPKPKATPAPKAVPKAGPVTLGGDYYVQLASIQDSKRADAEWNKLKSKYGSALSGYEYRVETAALAKGTYYRIQAGPVSKSQANTTCAAIKRINKNGCLVKKK